MTDFKCNCGAKFSVPDNAVGKKGKCPKCNQVVTIEKPITELEWNDDAMPLLKIVGKYLAVFFGIMITLSFVFGALGVPDIVMLYLSEFGIVTALLVGVYRNAPEEGRPMAYILGVVLYGSMIYAHVTYVPPHLRPKPVSYASSSSGGSSTSSSSSYSYSPSPNPAGWSDADQIAREGAIMTKMILEQQGYDSQTANDVAIRTWAFD